MDTYALLSFWLGQERELIIDCTVQKEQGMNDAGKNSTIMHLLVKRYIPIRVEHIGIRIWVDDMVAYDMFV